MTLHIKHNSSWEETQNVYIKHNGDWNQCKEVYIKKDGVWEPVLYTLNTDNITSTGPGTIVVPNGAFRVAITVIGGQGGAGGADGSHPTSEGGRGAMLTGTIDVTPGETLNFTIGSAGTNGQSHAGSASGGTGGTGWHSGGDGGNAGPYGSSGGGGGGGGSSVVYRPGQTILLAGGGGGGSGSGNRQQLSATDAKGKNSNTIIHDNIHNASNGEDGLTRTGSDGGAGGGGGAGVPGGAGGTYILNSYDSDGYPGEAGISYYDPNLFIVEPVVANSYTGNGQIFFVWLP